MLRLRRPSWFAVLLTLAGIAFFVRLGIWQLDRAAYKEHLLARFAHATDAPLIPFAQVSDTAPHHAFAHIAVHGHYLPGRAYMWDDQTIGEQVGVDVYVPFVVQGHARLVIVNLGFLPHGNSELDRRPQMPPLPAGELTLHGLYASMPPPGLKLGGDQIARQKQWPKLSTYLELSQISRDLDQRLYPGIVLLDPNPKSAYLRDWTPTFIPPARHQAYAFQWFSFAAAALVIFIVLHRRVEPPKNDRQD
ncbi:SURF1 family protein [Metallibacterium scheffleri]